MEPLKWKSFQSCQSINSNTYLSENYEIFLNRFLTE